MDFCQRELILSVLTKANVPKIEVNALSFELFIQSSDILQQHHKLVQQASDVVDVIS